MKLSFMLMLSTANEKKLQYILRTQQNLKVYLL